MKKTLNDIVYWVVVIAVAELLVKYVIYPIFNGSFHLTITTAP